MKKNNITVLITCPPMLNNVENYKKTFANKGINLILPEVKQTLSESDLIKILPDVDGWIIGDDPVTKKVLAIGKMGKLKAAVKWGVGTDNIDFLACKEFGIPILNTPNIFGGEVADLAMSYILGLARDSFLIDRHVRRGNWFKSTGVSLTRKKIGILGLGDIGKSLINRLNGFDVDIIGYDPFTKSTSNDLNILAIENFPNRIEEIDFLVLTCSLTNENKYIINQDVLSLMKNNSSIVNVSRGGLIKETDLIKYLKAGKIKSVALDVFEIEPISKDNPLLQFENCIFGSHNGSNTKEAVDRASLKSIELLFSLLNIA